MGKNLSNKYTTKVLSGCQVWDMTATKNDITSQSSQKCGKILVLKEDLHNLYFSPMLLELYNICFIYTILSVSYLLGQDTEISIFFSIIERVIPRESIVLESKAELGKMYTQIKINIVVL